MKKSKVILLIVYCIIISISLGIWVGTFTYNKFVQENKPAHEVKLLKVWTPYENIKCFHMVVDGDTIVGCSVKYIEDGE